MWSLLIMNLFCGLLLFLPSILAVPTPRIIGGNPAFAGEFPYAAAIYKTTSNGQYFCVGSLISSLWVITAGQCVDSAISFTVVLGTNLLNSNGANVQKLATDNYILHPDYNPLTLENDVGLIQFRLPVTFTTYIAPSYLPAEDIEPGGLDAFGTAFGWGQTSDADGSLSNALNYVTLTAVDDAECRITYGGQLGANMMCFEGAYNEGTCFGDVGSPVVQHVRGGYALVVAISSFISGNGCESTDPSGYTRVFPYVDWINNATNSLQ